MMDGSNTADNSRKATGRPFTKGDPRINRKGRPKSFDALRELAQQIAHEPAELEGQPIVIHGHVVTVAEAVLRKWIKSGNPQLQRAFMEIAFGKVPDAIDLTSKGEKIIVSLSDDERSSN